jgi:hypothetical protein
MTHIVLLGDSVFDNRVYVAPGPDVVEQVRADLPDWRATLLAVDGATTRGAPSQVGRLPSDATHLALSVGGNDALGHARVLEERVASVAGAVDRLASVQDQFQTDYRAALGTVLERRLPTLICTIYNPRFPDPVRQRLSVAALSILNDVIIRSAFEFGLPLIDLRLVCSDPRDYANAIEPSVRGGEKIAAAIASVLLRHDFGTRRTQVFW